MLGGQGRSLSLPQETVHPASILAKKRKVIAFSPLDAIIFVRRNGRGLKITQNKSPRINLIHLNADGTYSEVMQKKEENIR
jgi:hypothetical protein